MATHTQLLGGRTVNRLYMLMAQGYVVGVVLGLRRSVRGIFLSVRDGGVCRKIQRGSVEGRRRKREKKRVKNLSEGRGKCISDLVAAGLTGLHGHGWANGYYTATCAKKSLGYVTLSCGEVCWCAEVLRYASPKAAGVRRYSRMKT